MQPSKPQLTAEKSPQSPSAGAGRWRLHLSRFDRFVFLVILLLLGTIGLTILLGDRVGVTLERVGPLGTARATSTIVIQFSENMNRDTVPARLRVAQLSPEQADQPIGEESLEGEVFGTVSWNGSTISFRPSEALDPGATYTVILQPGAESENGRKVLSEYRFSFNVRSPRIAYLAPANSVPYNLWIADPADPTSVQQITASPSGIYDYGISPDGTKIAFSERNSNSGTNDIKLLDLESGTLEQLTNCVDAECKTPVFRPDGQVIAYERIDLNSDLSNVGASPTRIWLLDLSTRPATTRPMFEDSQLLGYYLRWSQNGSRVSVFDYASQGILVYDFTDQSTVIIPSQYGNPGEISPDGTRIVFPEIQLSENQATSYLQMVDLSTQELIRLSNPDEPVDDDVGIWSPDGTYLVIGRRYLDERYTRGRQLFKLNPDDLSSEPLVFDDKYTNGVFSFDPTGTQLLIQRFPDPIAMDDPNNMGLPEVWVYNMETQSLVKVADNAFFPRWVP